ncbi:MAG: hypothetical protein KAR45_17990, partial [Desulfobacteraceae bacterium]|nr:hypothetical protein [Desulfobacteraceae bacterium]
FQHMNNNSIVIININDPRFQIMKAKAEENPEIDEIIYFGTDKDADIQAGEILLDQGMTKFSILQKNKKNIDVSLNSPAPFMIANALAACAAALKAGVNKEDIKKGLKAFTPVKGRMNFIKVSDKLNLIDDTYNANPDSVKQALITLSLVSGDNNSIAVLGDMLELGEDALILHEETGKVAAENKISKIYTYGKLSSNIIKGAVKAGFPEKNTMNGTREEIAEKIIKETYSPSSSSTSSSSTSSSSTPSSSTTWVLVKGSRGMEMEKVIQEIHKLTSYNNETGKRL